MQLDQLIEQTTIHEKTAVMVDRRVTTASRTAFGCCAAAAAVYRRTRADDAGNLVEWIVDWFGYPTAGYIFTFVVLVAGVVLAVVTKGFVEANQQAHQAMVGFIIAAGVTVVPVLLAVMVWLVFVMVMIVMFATVIGFAVLVFWALLQTS